MLIGHIGWIVWVVQLGLGDPITKTDLGVHLTCLSYQVVVWLSNLVWFLKHRLKYWFIWVNDTKSLSIVFPYPTWTHYATFLFIFILWSQWFTHLSIFFLNFMFIYISLLFYSPKHGPLNGGGPLVPYPMVLVMQFSIVQDTQHFFPYILLILCRVMMCGEFIFL